MAHETKPIYGFRLGEDETKNRQLEAKLARITNVLDFTSNSGVRYLLILATLDEITAIETKVGARAIKIQSSKEVRHG